MRRVRRVIPSLLAGLLLLTALLVLAVWARSFFASDSLNVSRVSVDGTRGRWVNYSVRIKGPWIVMGRVSYSEVGAEAEVARALSEHRWLSYERGHAIRGWRPNPLIDRGRLGFYYASELPGEARDLQRLTVPALPLGFASGVASVLLFVGPRLRRLSRRAHGQCPECGYDLRATVERCPECGTEALARPAAAA